MTATTSEWMLRAIEGVLCDGDGVERTLPAAHRFRRGLPADLEPSDLAREAHVRKTVVVMVSGAERDARPATDPVASFPIRVTLDVWYQLPHDVEWNGLRKIQIEAADDMGRVSAALERWQNLASSSGNDTGLGSGMLRFVSWTLDRPDTTQRLQHATFRFEGVWDYEKPS